MATQALYRKWRSQTFAEVIGQTHITQTLQNALETNRVGHAYLFTGPRGTGKTSTARILAKAVNCTGQGTKPCTQCNICQAVSEGRLMDLIEIDAASNTSVDDIRDLREKVDFRPGQAEIKFYIIDEVHMLSKSAFNALLKTLEEPPAHVIFVLATTEPERIPATITSRCQRFDFRRIKIEDVADWLQHICNEEKIEADPDALTLIARQGGGSMRDSISLLDQLTTYGDEGLTLDLVRSVLGTADSSATQRLVDYITQGEVSAGLRFINEVIQEGIDPRQFTLQLLEYMRGLLLIKYDNGQQFLNLPNEALTSMKHQADSIAAPKLLKIIERLNDTMQAFRSAAGEVVIPQLPLELVFVEITSPETGEIVGTISQSTPVNVQAKKPEIAPDVTSSVSRPAIPSQPAVEDGVPHPQVQTESAPPAPGNVSDLSVTHLQAQWPAVGAELKRQNNGMAQALLNSGQVVGLQGQKIIFSLPSPILKERSEKQRPAIQAALDAVLGQSVSIEFTVGTNEIALTGDTGTPSTQADFTESDVQKKKTVDEDPLIKSALALGGKIKGVHPLDKL